MGSDMATHYIFYKQLFLYVFITVISYDYVLCSSGGFYVDDGTNERSILYKPLTRQDKRQLQRELLQLLALKHRPKWKVHDTASSAPHYLFELYKTLDENKAKNVNQPLRDSDVIVSFVNKQFHHQSHLRHEHENTLFFDVSHVNAGDEVMNAELKIYRNKTACANDFKKSHKQIKDSLITLSLFTISEDGSSTSRKLELADEITISPHSPGGWLNFNLSGPLKYWIAFPQKNHGLLLKVKSPHDSHSQARNLNLKHFDIIGSTGPGEYQPFVVGYFKSSARPLTKARSPRAAKKKKQHDTYYDHDNFGSGRDRYLEKKRSCQRKTLFVSFRDLDWADWIIAPNGYAAFFCSGECTFPLNANMNSTNHAIVQTLVHLIDPSAVPKPCCAPTQLSAITVLYFDDNSNVILKRYKHMVVKSCGCQ